MYQIWIPSAGKELVAAADRLYRVGLDELAAGFAQFPLPEGPDGQPGSMYCWGKPKWPAVMQPLESLEWVPAIAWCGRPAGRYQVGIPRSLSADDLARRTMFPGRYVKLGRDQWLIPIPALLPQSLLFGSDGELQTAPQLRLNEVSIDLVYAQQVDQITQRLLQEQEPEVDWEWLRNFALKALSVNYRMLPEVCNHLQLIDQLSAKAILFAACGAFENRREA